MARLLLFAIMVLVLLSCRVGQEHPGEDPQPDDRGSGDGLALGVSEGMFRADGPKARMRIWLPRRLQDGFRLEDARSAMAVTVSMLDATDAAAEVSGGRAFYPRGHRSGADVVLRATDRGVEDLLHFVTRPSDEGVRYLVTLHEVAGLRLVAGQLELLDEGGAPRLRVQPPYLVDADGVRHDATLEVVGCDYDVDPRGPWGRPTTAPGAPDCVLRVRWDGSPVIYPAWLDPFWTTTDSLAIARFVHAGSLLQDGRVLVTGGFDEVAVHASAELYDPDSETWSATGSLATGRFRHSMNVLEDGRVLVVGGFDDMVSFDSAELYDPLDGTWSTTGSLATPRHNHTATVLPDASVLVAGGQNTAQLASAERYDATTGTWSPTAAMASQRSEHRAVQLVDGRVLVMGGHGPGALASAELYDPDEATWTAMADMTTPRMQHSATRLADGRVLVVGGRDTEDLLTTEIFDPATLSWIPSASTQFAWRQHSATLLTDDRLLVTGGWSRAELYDPGADAWSPTDNVVTPRRYHTSHRFPEGRLMMVAGRGDDGPLASAEIFSPLGNLADPCTLDDECASGYCVDGVCCVDACGDGAEGDCLACDLAGSEGSCAPEQEGVPCGVQGAACQIDDACGGDGVCITGGPSPDGTACDGGSCIAGSCEMFGDGGADPGPTEPAPTEAPTSGGCGCGVEPAAGSTRGGVAMALLGLGLVLRRRRRQLP